MEEQRDWLTRQEAAKRAGVHYNTIRTLELDGVLRRKRGGPHNAMLVSAEDLARWTQRREARATALEGGPTLFSVLRVVVDLQARIADLEDRLNEVQRQSPAGKRDSV